MKGGADRDGSMALLLGQVWVEDGDDQRMVQTEDIHSMIAS